MRKDWLKVLFRKRILVAMMIILQLAFFVGLILSGSMLSKIIHGVLNLISIIVVMLIIRNKTKNAYKIIWIVLILLFPVFGGTFYLMLKLQSSTRKFGKLLDKIENKTYKSFYLPEHALDGALKAAPEHSTQMKYLQVIENFPVYERTDSKYFSVGEEMFKALLEELKKAKKYIFLEYFIIEEGIMWNEILDVLTRKVTEGVDVRIIYDDLGCFLRLPKDYPEKLGRMGIKCKVFNPFRPFVEALQNNRDHRKIAIIDGETAFTGGINLADEYINQKIKFGHWKDTAIMLKGDGAWSLTVMFLQMWSLCTGASEDYEDFYSQAEITGKGYVQPFCDSPIDMEKVAEHIYLHIINSAKDYLYITTPYLILDENIQTALEMAVKSGVDVRIITPGIWDKKFVHLTTRSYYRELINAGIKIYEYEKGFMHSKTFVSDDKIATVGTVNLDYRSLYLHFECGVCLYNTDTVLSVKEDFEQTLKKCHCVSKSDYKGSIAQLTGEICRLFAPLL